MASGQTKLQLETIIDDFTACLVRVDAQAPQAVNARSKMPYQKGIGPHPEGQTVEMVTSEMEAYVPVRYSGLIATSVPYSDAPKQKCDFCIGSDSSWDWAIEVKMLRMLGDNGKPNDNILMHILSPYSRDRSAVTECEKLSSSTMGHRKAILIYGYEAEKFPIITAIDTFETIAMTKVSLSPRVAAGFSGLIHPVHASGAVFGWELEAVKSSS